MKASNDKQGMEARLNQIIQQHSVLQDYVQTQKPNDLWLYDVAAKTEFLSHSFWTLLGYYAHDEDVRKRSPYLFSHYEDTLQSLLAKAKSEPGVFHSEMLLYQNRHGALLPLKCVVFGVSETGTETDYIFGAHLKIDIGVSEETARETSAQDGNTSKGLDLPAANELNQVLRAMNKCFPGAEVFLISPDWEIEFSNTAQSKTFEQQFSRLQNDALVTVQLNFIKAFEGGQAEFELVSGSIHESFHIFPLFASEGYVKSALCIIENVTEQKKHIEALKESEAHLKVATQLAKIGYWELDIASGVFTFNEQFINILGVSPDYFGGLKVPAERYAEEFLLDEDKPMIQEETRMAIETDDPGYSRYVEHRFRHKSGEIRYLAARFFVVRDNDGKVIKTVGANQDITERKQAEQSLKRLIDKTSDQNARLRDFSFIISHNIRSSVANLISLSDLLTEQPDNSQFVRMISDTANNLDQTIKNVNELLNFENDVGGQSRHICYLREVIDRAVNLNKNLIEEKGIDIQIYISANTQVMAFPAYIESVFYNLISNAIKYGVNENSRKIILGQEACEQGVHIYVQDFGDGLDLEKQGEKLFQLGVRMHSGNSGQGLGLFMTKHQIEAMDGKIWVESELNKGTRFNVIFTS